MTRIYLDNAATTALDADVLQAMMPYLSERYGNPSSIHHFGREARAGMEKARKECAALLGARPAEIFFTSCGTESTNTVLTGAVRDLGRTRIISSPIEHHATLHAAEFLQSLGLCRVDWLRLGPNGHIDYDHLEELLQEDGTRTLVSLMHANNEIGNITDIQRVGELCRRFGALLHTDAVQTVAHLPLDLSRLPVDFLSASAHKFHGPKGSGLLFVRGGLALRPFIHGGAQERNMRAGTENVANAVGFAAALEKALRHLGEEHTYIQSLKSGMMEMLQQQVPGIGFHGDTTPEASLYTVLNAGFELNNRSEMLSMNLDVAGIAVSGGSACSSGAQGGSHVIRTLYPDRSIVPIRFSFSRHNTFEELEHCAATIGNLMTT